MDNILKHKQQISEYINNFFASKQTTGIFPQEVLNQILSFTLAGKMVRGSIMLSTYEIFKNDSLSEILPAACALELIQTGLLIHDDIMDNDKLRRGMPTIHDQYRIKAENIIPNPEKYGESVGICIGDICFFMAYELLGKIKTNSSLRSEAFSILSSELQLVGLAQINDVTNGYFPNIPSFDEILTLYKFKTARYTFSIPLILGALLANKNKKTLDALSKIGEYIGILFQIRDDYLGIFGESNITGKSIMSDLKENKKTIYLVNLMTNCNNQQKTLLLQTINKKPTSADDLLIYKKLLEDTGTLNKINDLSIGLDHEAKKLIKITFITETDRNFFYKILSYVQTRNA